MKRLGRFLGNLLAMLLTVISVQAMAETQLGGRDFNHMTTGFPLSGGHATAACETCHVGGVFKGTPRNCDGCHALGKRIVATPKSNSHIVTDAPCESCHFNTSTFLGARFNHATARPGDCTSCHNGRITKGKQVAHLVTAYSCDQCHRTSSWIPASWNHTNNAMATYSGQSCDSSQCHAMGGAAQSKSLATADRHLPSPTPGTVGCQSCHISYNSFAVVKYIHPAGLTCFSCHNNSYKGIRGMPANHIPLNAGATCQNCHSGGSSWGGMDHTQVSTYTCRTCHLSGTSYLGNMEKKSTSHESMGTKDCSSSGCHKPIGNRGTTYIKWD